MSYAAVGIILCLLFLVILFYTRFKFKSQLQSLQNQSLQITLDKNQEHNQMEEYKHRYEIMFEHAITGFALVDLDGFIRDANHSFCQLFGYNKKEMLSANFYFLMHPVDVGHLQINIQNLLDNKLHHYKSEEQCYRKNGEVLWIMMELSILRNSENKPLYFIAQVQDISWQKRAETERHHYVYHDALTSLANINKLEPFIKYISAHAERHHSVFAVLVLDIDSFKSVNETIGHEAGDLLLQIIADRLLTNMRATDMVARLGDDEFVIVCTDIKTAESSAYIAQKILEDVFKPVMLNDQEVYTTASIGISCYPDDAKDLPTLLKHADDALYRAKENGGNQYQFYLSEITHKANQKIALQNALSQALLKNEFRLYYQPKMDINTRRITGVEAFLRWHNKEFGNIATHKIIASAEETGLIVNVTDWILKAALQQLKQWHEMGFKTLTMAVNFSSRPFKQSRFTDEVLNAIREAGVPPDAFEVEINEKAIMVAPEHAMHVLHALRAHNISLTIDNFGIGYWSMHHLKEVTINKIKIDKSYVHQAPKDEVSAAIIRAIIAMAKNLNVITIAEGVESKEQFQVMAKEGCTEIQGYYLKKALPAHEMTEFLKHPIPDAEMISQE